MSRRPRPKPRKTSPGGDFAPRGEASRPEEPGSFWTPARVWLAVGAMLVAHWSLAVSSLLAENPTVDEVVHLPAGVTYWQRGTFRLYPHNPPLVKLVAALPVVLSGPSMDEVYRGPYWASANKTGVAHLFAQANAGRYFELFARARLLMPAFGVIGGLAVFLWSRSLYGPAGGLLSLALWSFCPNVLAHARLVTTDVPATVLGFAATYLFWRYLRRPTWGRAAAAGVALGLAELAKFSMLLLYLLWPLIWLIQELPGAAGRGVLKRVAMALAHGVAIVALSVLVIDAGYGFEGLFWRLGDFPFVSDTLTRPRERPSILPPRPTDLLGRVREYRVNRFRGTPLAGLPVPLPRYYVTGFDEQKIEADGIRRRFAVADPEVGDRMGPEGDEVTGYPVYLDGQLRDRSWWDFYLRALAYKVPEGTWALVLLSLGVLVASPRSRASWADELTLLAVPVAVLGVMSFLTNINLGLRYVLPIFPYVFTSAGKVAPWALGLRRRRLASGAVGACLAANLAATAAIHPHYLAYFNAASGGPARGSEHLIDSSLDWGQDLVGLREWAREHAPREPIGLAYFGQINPAIFAERGDPLDWFLPPPRPGTMPELPPSTRALLPPRPGLYAVSASLLRGLPWRVYDYTRWAPYVARGGAFSYFRELTPIADVGHSILIYCVSREDADRLARHWPGPNRPSR